MRHLSHLRPTQKRRFVSSGPVNRYQVAQSSREVSMKSIRRVISFASFVILSSSLVFATESGMVQQNTCEEKQSGMVQQNTYEAKKFVNTANGQNILLVQDRSAKEICLERMRNCQATCARLYGEGTEAWRGCRTNCGNAGDCN